MTRFYLMRHAPTSWNREKRIQGSTDISLDAGGEVSARKWGECLVGQGLDAILSSPLVRAVQTAHLIAGVVKERCPVEVVGDLREQNFGDWEGQTYDVLRTTQPGTIETTEAMGWGFTPPGGESWISVRSRVVDVLEREGSRRPEGRILVVTHLSLMKCLIYHLLGGDFRETAMVRLTSAHCHEVLWSEERGLSLGRINALSLEGCGGKP